MSLVDYNPFSKFHMVCYAEHSDFESTKSNEKIKNVVLGSKLLDACREGNRDEINSILSEITCFDSLTMVDGQNKTAFSHLVSNGMFDIAERISHRQLSHLIDACRENDLNSFEYLCEKIDEEVFRYAKLDHEELTLILGAYSDILKCNWGNASHLNNFVISCSKMVALRPKVNQQRNYSLKRCAEADLCEIGTRDGYFAFSRVDSETRNLVFGSQLLNACKVKDEDAAFVILSKIESYSGLKLKDAQNNTALKYAVLSEKMKETWMNDGSENRSLPFAIKDKILQLFYRACLNDNFTDIKDMIKRIGVVNILKHKKYTEEERSFIIAKLKMANLIPLDGGIECLL